MYVIFGQTSCFLCMLGVQFLYSCVLAVNRLQLTLAFLCWTLTLNKSKNQAKPKKI